MKCVDMNRLQSELQVNGLYLQEKLLQDDLVAQIKLELIGAIAEEDRFHEGKNHKDHGMVLLCAKYGGSFLEIFDLSSLMEPFEYILGEGCIVYANTSTSLPPYSGNFSTRIHVDSPRIISNYNTSLMALILLDDFTEENGATWYLPGSHLRQDAPSEEEFYSSASRLIAPSGSVLFWNPRVWHAGGLNKTSAWRHAMTIVMCRPFMKQRINIPKILDRSGVIVGSEKARQKLGYYSQVPESYEEYYLPPEARKFRQKAE
jgi:ectoine hydroxylase-related dioxygenase (phytanoyl-CoA dioxygenase family)